MMLGQRLINYPNKSLMFVSGVYVCFVGDDMCF